MGFEEDRELPIFKKAEEIGQITEVIVSNIDIKKDVFLIRDQMRMNGYLIGAKIAAAEGGGLYSLRMECAVLVKIAARELMTQTSILKHDKLGPPEYIKLLRDEIENFRLLFIDWVNSFDKNDDIKDDWGELFR